MAHCSISQLPYGMGEISVRSLLSLATEPGLTLPEIQGTNVLKHLQIPLRLPELEVDQNYLGGYVAIGYVLFAITTLLCLYFSGWTWKNRMLRVVKVAQPDFLLMVSVGCIVMSSATIPLSFDDHSEDFTASQGQRFCMAIPWLFVLGFTITFSALFAKTWRITWLIKAGEQMQQVTVTKRDVGLPFVLLLLCNVVTLSVWNVVNPRQYVRLDATGTDEWNRVIATYGVCQSPNSEVPYLATLAVLNFGLLLMANIQAWRARHVKSLLSESQYIAAANAVGGQAFLIGMPLLFLSRTNPLSLYLTMVMLNFILCTAVATLIFVPRQNFARMDEDKQRAVLSNALTDSLATASSMQIGNRHNTKKLTAQ